MLAYLVALTCFFADPHFTDTPDSWSDEITASLRKYEKQCIACAEAREILIGQQQDLIVGLGKWHPYKTADKKRKIEALSEAKLQIELLRNNVVLGDLGLDTLNPKRGYLGFLQDKFRVDQVLEDRVVGKCGEHDACAIIGLDSSDIADGEVIWVKQLLECVGPQPYKAVNGATRTLWTYRVGPTKQLREWNSLRRAAFIAKQKTEAKTKKK